MSFITKVSIFLNRLMLSRAENGPYRFLIKNLEKKSPLNLVTNILSTEYFKDEIIPLPLPIEKFERILVISPHQDDETIGAGGTLIKCRNASAKIHILYITDGGLINYPGGLEKSVGDRFREAQIVCDRLNAKLHRLDISNHKPSITKSHIQQLVELINLIQPEIILIPWILDSPPKHRLSNHLFAKAEQYFSLPNIEVWGYQVHNMIFPNGYIDITNEMQEKRSLLDEFKSQNELYAPYNHMTQGMNAWNSRFIPFDELTSEAKYIELFFTLPLKSYCELIRKFYEKSLEDTYGSDPKTLEAGAGLTKLINSSTK